MIHKYTCIHILNLLYIHTYMHHILRTSYIYIRIYIHKYICKYRYTYIYVYIYIYICTHIYKYISYMYLYAKVYICFSLSIYVIYMYTYTNIYVYTCIDTAHTNTHFDTCTACWSMGSLMHTSRISHMIIHIYTY